MKVVSLWHEGVQYTFNGKRKRIPGSIFQDFDTVRSAIDTLNEENSKLEVQWFVYGLPNAAGDLDRSSSEDSLSIVYGETPNNIDDIFENCSLLLVPDVYEYHYNILALSAILHGIPTLVSHESSIGRMLTSLKKINVDKAIVTLTTDSNLNKEVWKEKIDGVCKKYEDALKEAQVICKMLKDSPVVDFSELYSELMFRINSDHEMKISLTSIQESQRENTYRLMLAFGHFPYTEIPRPSVNVLAKVT